MGQLSYMCVMMQAIEEMYPKEVADRIDDRWLLRQRQARVSSLDALEDEVDQVRRMRNFASLL